MKLKVQPSCPLDGFNECRKLGCAWFTQVRGAHPQTGEPVDEWGCAMAWMPVLMVQNAQMARQTGAAVESFRNEMVRLNDAAAQSRPAITTVVAPVQEG